MSTFRQQVEDQIQWYKDFKSTLDIDMVHRIMLDEIRIVLDYNLKQPRSEARDQYIQEIKSYLSFQETLSTRERIALYALLGTDGMFGAN